MWTKCLSPEYAGSISTIVFVFTYKIALYQNLKIMV
jgi:hypothetical protein